jgi:hypothetical protein
MERFARLARHGLASLPLISAVGCATYDPAVVVNPVLAATRVTIAENIERTGALGRQTGFVSLYVADLGTRTYFAIVSDDREEGEPLRVLLLEARVEIDRGAMEVTLLGDAGASLAFSIPGAERSAGTFAAESFSTLDLEFATKDGRVVELEFDLDLDDDAGSCRVERAVRVSPDLLGLFARRGDEAELDVTLRSARAGKETELWIGDAGAAPVPPPVEPPPPPGEAADGEPASRPPAAESGAKKLGATAPKTPKAPKDPTKPPAKGTAPAGKKPPAQGTKPPKKKPAATPVQPAPGGT